MTTRHVMTQEDIDAAWTRLRFMMGYGGKVEPISTKFVVPTMESLIDFSERYSTEGKRENVGFVSKSNCRMKTMGG